MCVADFANSMLSWPGRKGRSRLVKNLLTIDLENWHQLAYRRITGDTPLPQRHVFRQMDLLLELLDRHKTHATFFVLGSLAEQFPELPRRVASLGHEIASHGYAHLVAHRLTRKEFEEDTRRSKQVLEDVVGRPVCGYRAAEFSIRADSLWALEVLAELGFEYDSSIFPIYHRRYGIPGFFPRAAEYLLPNGGRIKEIPLATLSWGAMRLPMAGGGCFRVVPRWLLSRAVRRLNDSGMPLVSLFPSLRIRFGATGRIRFREARSFATSLARPAMELSSEPRPPYNYSQACYTAAAIFLYRHFRFSSAGDFS